MKTVQTHLKSVDKEELINVYLYKYPVNLYDLSKEYDGLTIAEVKALIKNTLNEFINHLLTLKKASGDGKSYFLMAHARLSDCSVQEIDTSLFCLEEVLQRDCPEAYGYAFTRQAEVMGYYVADNDYTQRNILDVLADMMHEVSFFGMKQESLEQFMRDLDESRRQIEAGQTLTFEESDEKFNVKYEVTWDRSRLENEALEVAYTVNRAYIDRELKLIREKYRN